MANPQGYFRKAFSTVFQLGQKVDIHISLLTKETIRGKVHTPFTPGSLKGWIGCAEVGLMGCDH